MFREEYFLTPDGEVNMAVGPKSGPPLLMFHGVTRRWECFLPFASQLAHRWHVHLLDFPGHGKSRATLNSYRVIDYVTVAKWLLDNHFSQPTAIYGHSLGAMVACGLAAKSPDQVTAVVMEDPPFHTMGMRIAQTPLLGYFKSLQPFAGKPITNVSESLAQLSQVTITDPNTNSSVTLANTRTAPALRFMLHCLSVIDHRVLDAIVDGGWLEGYPVEEYFQQVNQPALLFRADPALGGMLTADDSKTFMQLASDLSIVYRANVGHQMRWGDPGWLGNETLQFLETVRD